MSSASLALQVPVAERSALAQTQAPPTTPSRGRDSLVRPLVGGMAVIVVLAASLTILAAMRAGPDAAVAGALGVAAMALALTTCAWLLRSVLRPALRASAAAQRMSAGDLTQAADAAHSGELRPLLEGLEQVRQSLIAVVGEVRSGTTSVAMNSSQITRDNDALAQRTVAQGAALQETAATCEELTAAVRSSAETVRQAHGLVRQATERAEQGGAVMHSVVQAMESIRHRSHGIRDIVGVIDAIAFQTGILALNAAVEAARTGDQGRGFAVVAAEVRTLAERCATGARDVRQLITASVDKVELGGRRVEEAGRAMAEIVETVRQVTQLIAHFDGSTREQSDGIEAINEAIARIDQATQENALLVQDAAKTAAALHERAVAMLKGVAVFDLGGREHGTADEAVALVRAGCEFHRQHGRPALIEEVNKLAQGRFVDRDLYLMVIGAQDSVFLAHGNNPRTLGLGPKSRDADGKPFVLEMTATARAHGEGWIDYKWAHPVTNEVLVKSSFVQRVGDVVVACGIYR